jgi:hypothetical protein
MVRARARVRKQGTREGDRFMLIWRLTGGEGTCQFITTAPGTQRQVQLLFEACECRYAERTAWGEWQKQRSQWHKAGTDRSIGTHSGLIRYSMLTTTNANNHPRPKPPVNQSPTDPRTRSHPRNSKFSTHSGTTQYGVMAGCGDDDCCEKRRLAMR